MGTCCVTKTKAAAFRQSELNAPLLDTIVPRLNKDAQFIIVRLRCMRKLPVGNTLTTLTDAVCEIKLVPGDPLAGQQLQTSSIKPENLNPQWEPPERFQFIMSEKNQNAKILFSVYHYDGKDIKTSAPIGDALLKFRDLEISNVPYVKTLLMICPQDGSQKGEIDIEISVLSSEEAKMVQEDTLYEFERWMPEIEWGHTPKHFLPTDPGRFCSQDGKQYARELDDVAPVVPKDFVVTNKWHNIATSKDGDGWQYSTAFSSPYWYEEANSATFYVRRRTWHRVSRKPRKGEVLEISGVGRSDSTSTSGGGGSGSGSASRRGSGAPGTAASISNNNRGSISSGSSATTTGTSDAKPGRRQRRF